MCSGFVLPLPTARFLVNHNVRSLFIPIPRDFPADAYGVWRTYSRKADRYPRGSSLGLRWVEVQRVPKKANSLIMAYESALLGSGFATRELPSHPPKEMAPLANPSFITLFAKIAACTWAWKNNAGSHFCLRRLVSRSARRGDRHAPVLELSLSRFVTKPLSALPQCSPRKLPFSPKLAPKFHLPSVPHVAKQLFFKSSMVMPLHAISRSSWLDEARSSGPV